MVIIFTFSDSSKTTFMGYSFFMVSSKISNNFVEVSSKGIILYFSPFINLIIAADNFAVGNSIL